MTTTSETIVRLMEENVRLEQRSALLDQLLFAVHKKVPGESRFDTALRYIRVAESGAYTNNQATKQAMPALDT